MKRYKLIKTYPGSPDTIGYIVEYDKDNDWYASLSEEKVFFKEAIENYPEHWQKLELLFYTEDFIDGSFPEKNCYDCTNYRHQVDELLNSPNPSNKCSWLCRRTKQNWKGGLKGEQQIINIIEYFLDNIG